MIVLPDVGRRINLVRHVTKVHAPRVCFDLRTEV